MGLKDIAFEDEDNASTITAATTNTDYTNEIVVR